MTQYDFGTIDPEQTSGTQLATLIGNFRDALASLHSGPARPTYAKAGTVWISTASAVWSVNLYDGDTDISIGVIDTANNVFRPNLTTWALEVSLASAATTNVLGAASPRVAVTGNATITSLGSKANTINFVRFTGAATLTHNANIILPGAQNIITRAGDQAIISSDNAGVATLVSYQRADGSSIFGDIATLASSATTDLGSRQQQSINISGTTNITSFGNVAPVGTVKILKFDSSLAIIASANIVIPGGQNVVVAANDMITVRHEGGGVWRVVGSQSAASMAGGGQNSLTPGNAIVTSPTTPTGTDFINTSSANLSLSTKSLSVAEPLIVAIGNGLDLTGIKNKLIQKTANFSWDNLAPNARNYLYIDETGTPGSTITPPERVKNSNQPVMFTGSLFHMENSPVDDYGLTYLLETLSGNSSAIPTFNSSVPKYGGYCLEFTKANRTQLALVTPTRIAAADAWTVEFEVRKKSTAAQEHQLLRMTAGGNNAYGLSLSISTDGRLLVYASSDGGNWNLLAGNTSAVVFNDTNYHHVAVCYSTTGGYKFFVDGALVLNFPGVTTKVYTGWNKIFFGENTLSNLSGYGLDGYLDEIRITPGIARYSAAFSRPTAAWSPDQRDVFYDHINLMRQFPSGVPSNRVYVGEAVTSDTAVTSVFAYQRDKKLSVGPLVWSNGQRITVKHGLGCVPTDIKVHLISQGYLGGVWEAGDRLVFSGTANSTYFDSNGAYGIGMTADDVNIYINIASGVYTIGGRSGAGQTLTPSAWRMIVEAEVR